MELNQLWPPASTDDLYLSLLSSCSSMALSLLYDASPSPWAVSVSKHNHSGLKDLLKILNATRLIRDGLWRSRSRSQPKLARLRDTASWEYWSDHVLPPPDLNPAQSQSQVPATWESLTRYSILSSVKNYFSCICWRYSRWVHSIGIVRMSVSWLLWTPCPPLIACFSRVLLCLLFFLLLLSLFV